LANGAPAWGDATAMGLCPSKFTAVVRQNVSFYRFGYCSKNSKDIEGGTEVVEEVLA